MGFSFFVVCWVDVVCRYDLTSEVKVTARDDGGAEAEVGGAPDAAGAAGGGEEGGRRRASSVFIYGNFYPGL